MIFSDCLLLNDVTSCLIMSPGLQPAMNAIWPFMSRVSKPWSGGPVQQYSMHPSVAPSMWPTVSGDERNSALLSYV